VAAFDSGLLPGFYEDQPERYPAAMELAVAVVALVVAAIALIVSLQARASVAELRGGVRELRERATTPAPPPAPSPAPPPAADASSAELRALRSQVETLSRDLEQTVSELNDLKAAANVVPAPPLPRPRGRRSGELQDLREQLRASHREPDTEEPDAPETPG
jgi:hypothetical protein